MALEQILSQLNVDKAWKHMHWLQEHAPVRINGTGDDLKAANYFAEQFEQYGLETVVDHFQTLRSIPGSARLRIMAPHQIDIGVEPCGHIKSTPTEGIEAELIDVSFGAEEHYRSKDVRGRIVLADITEGPPRPEKARIAVDRGAVGIIFSNLGPARFENIPMGAIKSVWGNPTRSSFQEIPALTAAGITRASGNQLRKLCRSGPVRVLLTAQSKQDWNTLPQPRARIRGAANTTGDVLVVGGHFDAWNPGMSDNAAGNALILELARIFAKHRDSLRRDIVFAMWNGHEIGEIAGSTWFLDTNWDELDEHGVTYFNIDSVGFAETDFFECASNTELVRFHRSVERRIVGAPTARRKLTRANEQPFFPLGMPALEGSFRFSEEQIAAWDNASGGWWWHSTADTIDKVDKARFTATGQLYVGYIHEMATSQAIPLDYLAVATDLADRIDTVAQMAKESFALDLPIAQFVAATRRLDELTTSTSSLDTTRQKLVNRTIMRLGRVLMPAFETYGGRYEQDRVGHPALKSPLPLLHELETFLSSQTGERQHNLLMTELIRGRNKMADALRQSIDLIDRIC